MLTDLDLFLSSFAKSCRTHTTEHSKLVILGHSARSDGITTQLSVLLFVLFAHWNGFELLVILSIWIESYGVNDTHDSC